MSSKTKDFNQVPVFTDGSDINMFTNSFQERNREAINQINAEESNIQKVDH